MLLGATLGVTLRNIAMPPELLRGIAQFNRREFFACHETLEDLWRAEPGPVRDLYQGILLVGVAFYHVERRNLAGARKSLGRGIALLQRLESPCQGVPVAALLAQARAAAEALERLGPDRLDAFDPSRIPVIEIEALETDPADDESPPDGDTGDWRVDRMAVDLATANRIIEACVTEAKQIGRNFSMVVVDEGGYLVAAQRMDGAAFLSPQIALGKAYGCAAFRREGPQLQAMGENAAFVDSLVAITGGKFVASLGAARIMVGGKQIGAVGVSGAAPEQDQQVAEAGVRSLG